MMWTLLAAVTHKARLHLALQRSEAMEALQICVRSPSEMGDRGKSNAPTKSTLVMRSRHK